MAKLIGKRYAWALYEAGLELNRLNIFKEDIKKVSDLIAGESDLQKILNHPKISKGEKKDLISSLFKDSIAPEILNFLYIIIDKRREDSLFDISKEFERLFNEGENILEVTAVTAVTMEENLKDKLIEVLSSSTNKKVVLSNDIDEDIIGGVLLRLENKIIDGTVKGQLESIEKAIKGATL